MAIIGGLWPRAFAAGGVCRDAQTLEGLLLAGPAVEVSGGQVK